MIGVVVSGTPWHANGFSPEVYHRFNNGRSAIETTLRNCMDAALIQRVVFTMPTEQSRKVLELDKKGRFDRNATVQYYDPATQDNLDILYYAALTHSFDHIVRINADQVLLPGWHINNVVVEYMESGGNDFCKTYSSLGFDVEVMPFWKLAGAFVTREEKRDELTESWKRLPESKLHFPRSFLFNLNETELFDSMLHTIGLGYDVDQVIEDYLDGDKQKATEK